MTALLALLTSLAMAQTVAVSTEVHGGSVSQAAAQSIVWHSLADRLGHDALVMRRAEAVEVMRAHSLTTLYDFDVRWHMEGQLVDEGFVAARRPTVVVTELVLEGDALREVQSWTRVGHTVVLPAGDGGGSYISLPESALQDVIERAGSGVRPPVWGERSDAVRLPVLVAADEEYRARYGEAWREVSAARIRRASALLSQAGVELEVVGHQAWRSDGQAQGLDELLADLAAQPRGQLPRAMRVGFTGQSSASWEQELEDIGRAYLPGRDLVIVDQQAVPGTDPSWDTAEEGVAVAHEVLHALGVPHLRQPYFLMSEVKVSTVHVLAQSTQELARAAVQARYVHWDPFAAMTLLSQTADTWLDDSAIRRDYVTENLAAGPGVPDLRQLHPGRTSSLRRQAGGELSATELAGAQPLVCQPSTIWGACPVD